GAPGMNFITISGRTLVNVLEPGEISPDELRAAGVADDSVVRVNRQGDIEVRRRAEWDVIGGLIGDFENRLKHATGMEWAPD
ncbi:MAG: hypothetical protein WD875_11070, partial [Pirellulales bacterium]